MPAQKPLPVAGEEDRVDTGVSVGAVEFSHQLAAEVQIESVALLRTIEIEAEEALFLADF